MISNQQPRVAADAPVATGAMLVMFQPSCCRDDACGLVESVFGRRPALSSDYHRRVVDFARDFRGAGMGYFDELGLAILEPGVGGFDMSAIEGLRTREEVLLVRPEYRIYAMGWLCRLLGFEKAKADAPAVADPAPAPDAPSPLQPAPAPIPTAPTDGVTWGVQAVGADADGYDGSGIKVAVLDTGFDFEHPDFAGRTVVSESFVDGETAQDGAGHGAHVSGTIGGPAAPSGVPRYGVAPGVELHIGKVLGNDGSGREGDMLAGILWALDEGCQVINMSLGRRPLPGDSSNDYDRVGQLALDRGALIVAAAGNESARGAGYVAPVGAPANARSIMAVGAVDDGFAVADFSNGGLNADGGAVDIAGPGVDIFSSTPGAEHYARYSGTSMATPHVAGVAALLAQSDANLRGQALWDALVSRARTLGLPAQDVGAGLAQAPTRPMV